MQILILCVQGCQLRYLDFNNNWNIGYIDKRKIQIASTIFFLFAKKKEKKNFIQFPVTLEYYVLGSQISVDFIDFNCYCHWFKTAIVSKQVVLHPLPH